MLIQGRDGKIVAFFRSNRRTLGAGTASGLTSHEGQPAKYIDLPLFSSDQRSEIHLGLYKISELLNLQHPGKVYHIADAAFYTAENLATLGTHTFWISRVPANPPLIESR